MFKLFHKGPTWLQVFFSTKQQHTRPDSFNQLISVFRKLIGQTVCSWRVGTKTCPRLSLILVFRSGTCISAAVTSYPIIPSRDVVSGRDGDALPPGPVPAAVRIPGKDALPASVAIATAVSQRQPLDLHRRTNIQMSLRRRCNRVYKSSGSITGINQPVFMYYSRQVCWNKTYKLL